MMDHKSLPPELWPTKRNIVSSWCPYKMVDLPFVLSKIKQLQLFVEGVSTGDHLFFYCQIFYCLAIAIAF